MRNIILSISLAAIVGGAIFMGMPKVGPTDFVNAAPSTSQAPTSQNKSRLVVVKSPVLTLAKKTTALLGLTDNAW
ncbi:hypothetical protein [Methylomagnum sp.]